MEMWSAEAATIRHVQNTDPSGNFLVINNAGGALCTACHTYGPTPSHRAWDLTANASGRRHDRHLRIQLGQRRRRQQ